MMRIKTSWMILVCLFVLPLSARADPKPDRLTIATWNLEWFFDEYQGDNYSDLAKKLSAPSRSEWEWRRNLVADAIAAMKPTILALQEVENRQVLWYLTQRLEKAHGLKYRIAFVQGGDFYTEQDVAILYRAGLVAYGRREQSQEMFGSKKYYNVQKHLLGTFQWGQGSDRETLTLITVHFRARAQAATVRRKQAQLIRHWASDLMQDGRHVIVLGDLNTEQPYGHVTAEGTVGILSGLQTATRDDDLVDLHQFLPAGERQTHMLPGKQFDRILVSRSLLSPNHKRRPGHLTFQRIGNRRDVAIRKGADKDHWNMYYEIPQDERDLSDHYPLVAQFSF